MYSTVLEAPKTIIDNLIALDIRSERLKLAKEFGADFKPEGG